jgi:molybdate transport system ATP-binding protein
VAVGRALLARPRALLLDEPLAGLDLPLRRRILPPLRAVARRFAIPLLYVTHSLEEALVLGSQVAVMDAGKLVAAGPPAVVLGHGAGGPEAPVAAGDTILEVVVGDHHASEGITDCLWGTTLLRASSLEAATGTHLFLALSPRDVILARHRPTGLSARNAVEARVEDVVAQEHRRLARLRLEGAPSDAPTLDVLLTPEAVAELALASGGRTFALFKSSALRPVGPAE